MPKVYSILQLPSCLSITGSKLLAQLHATVWEFLRVFSVNVRESIARRYSRPPRPAVPHGASTSEQRTIAQYHARTDHIMSSRS